MNYLYTYEQWCCGKKNLVGTLNGIMVTYPIVMGGERGEGARMNGHLSRVKIYVQTWSIFFLINGRHCNTSRLRCAVRNVVLFY